MLYNFFFYMAQFYRKEMAYYTVRYYIISDISLKTATVIARNVVWLNRWYAETLRKLYSILSRNDIAMNLYIGKCMRFTEDI